MLRAVIRPLDVRGAAAVIGGRVRTVQFRRLVDDLIVEGQVAEVWAALVDPGPRQHRHLLGWTEPFDRIASHRLVEVHGQEDVLERLGTEPGS